MRKAVVVSFFVFLLIIMSGCQATKSFLVPIKEQAVADPTNEVEKKYETSVSSENATKYPTHETKEKEYQSIWLVDSNGDKKLITALSEGLGYESPLVSPDFTKITLFRITKSLGDLASGVPVMYNLLDKTFTVLGSEVNIFSWKFDWFTNSQALLMDGRMIFDLGTMKTIILKGQPENIGGKNNLDGKPSPDGSKIAVFSSPNPAGIPLRMFLYNRQGEILKTIDTKIEPEFEDNIQSAIPVKFEWSSDNETIILEGWNQQENTCGIYRLNTLTGSVNKIIDNAFRPALSSQSNTIAILEKNTPGWTNKVRIFDQKGTLICERDFQSNNVYLGGVEWDKGGEKVFISGSFMIGNKVDRNGVIVWNIKNNNITRILYVPKDTYLVGVNPDGESIMVMDYIKSLE